MLSANMFILEWVFVVLNAANGLHAAARGWPRLALFCASAVILCAILLWHWTVTP